MTILPSQTPRHHSATHDNTGCHHLWSTLVDSAWDAVLKQMGPQDVGQLRQVSQAWKEDTGRALSELHLVDPCPDMLTCSSQRFAGLRHLTVTLTHPWPHDQQHPAPTHDNTATTTRPQDTMDTNGSSPQHPQLHPTHAPHLTELAVHGWPGVCLACEAHEPHAQPHATRVPGVPGAMLRWASAAGKLRVLRITRCAAPTPELLQGCSRNLRQLHLVNVDFHAHEVQHMMVDPPTSEEGGPPPCSPLVAALAGLPHLEVLSLQQQEPSLQAAQAEPSLAGLGALPALTSLSLAGSSRLLMQAAAQVPGWRRLSVLQLEAVQWQYRDAPTELCDLLAVMKPGAEGLTSFSCSGHTYVSDGCLSTLARLFPSLTHVALPLDEYAQDSSWNPLVPPAPPGGPHGAVTLAGLQPLVLGRRHPLKGLHLGHVPLTADALTAIFALTSLEQLDLSGCPRVDDSVLYRLCSLLRRIKHLGLSGCKAVSDIGLAQLAACLPQLTHLDVSDCDRRVTDLGITRLGALQRLTTLNLAGCHKVTDVGVRGLVGSPHRQHLALSHLNVSGCHHITDASLSVLAHSAPNLTRLSLDSLPSITAAGVMQLSALRHLRSASVAWCSDKVQAASAKLASHVMGHRLGPLMTVPPGILEAVHVPSSPSSDESPTTNSTTTTTTDPQLLQRTSLCTSSFTHCPHEMDTSLMARPSTDSVCSEMMRSEMSEMSEASQMSEMLHVPGSGGSSVSSSPAKRQALRFRSSPSCIGFVPLSEPAPRHASSCWWLPN